MKKETGHRKPCVWQRVSPSMARTALGVAGDAGVKEAQPLDSHVHVLLSHDAVGQEARVGFENQ